MKKIVENIEVNYDFRGQEHNGETLAVLLHGWGANINLFDNLLGLVAQKYPVLALDMPGFGETPEPPSAWDLGSYTDFVIKFIESFPYQKIVLLGHSFGGRVIIKMLSEKNPPFTVEKIILVDSAGIKPKKTFKQNLRQRIFKIGKGVCNFPPVKKLFPHALDNWRKKFGSADYNSASELMKTSLVKVVNEDLTENLKKITQDTLLIWGDKDTATPLADGKLMEKLIKNSGLVTLEGAGHYSFLDRQFIFNRVIASYLDLNI